MSKSKKIIVLAVLIIGISLLHYITNVGWHLQHAVYREIYFFPIFLAGFWFGLRGALTVSLSIAGIYLPYLIISWINLPIEGFDNLLDVVIFNVVAVIIGVLVDRQRTDNRRLREAESLAAMGRAFSALAHDIKTPLIAIGGFSRLVRKKLPQGDQSLEKLDIVIHETQRLEQMVKEILDFTRPLDLHRETGSLNEAISRSMSIVEEAAEGKKITLEKNFSDNVPEIAFDKGRMEQVLINLLMNAIQASPGGRTVHVATHRKGKNIQISIKDCGTGIPEERREKIFTPFFTTKRNGTGLGLPIARKIIDAHGGLIEIENDASEGCYFKVMIPFKG